MKYFYSFLILILICIGAIAQPLPIMRNAMSTNVAGTPVLSQNDLSVTNVGSGTNWLFYGIVTQTVARLGDVWGNTGAVSLVTVTNIITGYGPNMFILITNGVGTNTTFYGSNSITVVSNANIGGFSYLSNGLWITNTDDLAQLLYVNSRGSNLSAFIGTNSFLVGGDGDINGTGGITAADLTLLQNYFNGTVIFNADRFARADLCGNGIVTMTDKHFLRQVALLSITLKDAKYMERVMRGRSAMVGTNGSTRFGFITSGDLAPVLAVVEVCSELTTNAPAAFVVNTNWFMVNTNSFVGIGTNNPQASLHVLGSEIIETNLAVKGSNYVAGQAYFGNTVYVDGAGSGLEVDGLTVTNGITNFGTFFIRDNAVSNALWRCTNTTTGQGTWANNYLNSTEVSNLVASVAYGQTWFVWGSSNTLATNAAGTPYKAMLKGDTPLPATPNTNTYTTPTAGQYVGEVITAIPAGISLIVPGDIVTESFAFLSENRTMVLQPEIYIRTNMLAPSFSALGEREVAVGPSFTVNNTFQSFAVTVPVTTNITLSTTNYLVRKLRVVSVSGGTPNLLLVSQDGFPARVTFPIASSSFVLKSGDTMLGTLVLTNSYNVGTSFESRSTNANSQQFGSNTISGVGSIALGVNSKSGTGSVQSNSVAIGFKTEATNESTIAIGYNAHVGGNFSVGIGDGVTSGYGTSGSNSVAIGESSSIQSDYAIAIGSEASVAGSSAYGVAIGTLSTSGGSSAIAIGKSANASHANAIAIGDSATTTGNNEFVLGLSTHAVTIPGIVNITGYVTNNIKYTTNAAVNGAVVDMKFAYQTTNAAGAITYTGLSNTDPNRTLTTSLFIDANGADRLITIPASWKNHQVSTTFTVTNGWVGVLTICQYGNVMTNVAWTLIK